MPYGNRVTNELRLHCKVCGQQDRHRDHLNPPSQADVPDTKGRNAHSAYVRLLATRSIRQTLLLQATGEVVETIEAFAHDQGAKRALDHKDLRISFTNTHQLRFHRDLKNLGKRV